MVSFWRNASRQSESERFVTSWYHSVFNLTRMRRFYAQASKLVGSKTCSVIVRFQNGYQFQRERGVKETFQIIEPNGRIIQHGTLKDTNKAAESILGITYEMFVRTVLMASDTMLHFMKATDTQQRQYIEELLSIADLTEYHQYFNELIKNQKLQRQHIVSHMTTIANRLKNIDNQDRIEKKEKQSKLVEHKQHLQTKVLPIKRNGQSTIDTIDTENHLESTLDNTKQLDHRKNQIHLAIEGYDSFSITDCSEQLYLTLLSSKKRSLELHRLECDKTALDRQQETINELKKMQDCITKIANVKRELQSCYHQKSENDIERDVLTKEWRQYQIRLSKMLQQLNHEMQQYQKTLRDTMDEKSLSNEKESTASQTNKSRSDLDQLTIDYVSRERVNDLFESTSNKDKQNEAFETYRDQWSNLYKILQLHIDVDEKSKQNATKQHAEWNARIEESQNKIRQLDSAISFCKNKIDNNVLITEQEVLTHRCDDTITSEYCKRNTDVKNDAVQSAVQLQTKMTSSVSLSTILIKQIQMLEDELMQLQNTQTRILKSILETSNLLQKEETSDLTDHLHQNIQKFELLRLNNETQRKDHMTWYDF
jgi:DNA repair exonuclease SbcCD ATPase subunit